jgi:peptidoglycan/LPS O-acetylase OafA/YrhL
MNIQQDNLTILRMFAAVMVLYGHSFEFLGMTHPLFAQSTTFGPLGVNIFFSISGYLVIQSWESDPNLYRFWVRRILRIFPALTVCILLTIFLIGPINTKYSYWDYFKNEYTWGYLSNIYLYITFYLPGVFAENRVPNNVNGSLWSLPVEFSMYLILPILSFFGKMKNNLIAILILSILLSIFWAFQTTTMLVFYRTDMRQIAMCGVYFFMGACFHTFKIKKYFNLSYVLIIFVIWLSLSRWSVAFALSSWFCIPFIALAFGVSNENILSKYVKNDYSYGIYIYAFPIQQTIASIYPNINFYNYLIISILSTLLLAYASWHLIEKQFLKFKPKKFVSI